jgi:uncharacterized membrane protein YkvI
MGKKIGAGWHSISSIVTARVIFLAVDAMLMVLSSEVNHCTHDTCLGVIGSLFLTLALPMRVSPNPNPAMAHRKT